jgi:hypothetical protein
LEDPDKQEGFRSFLREFAHLASEKHDLFDALGQAGIDVKARFFDDFEELMTRIELLRQHAVEDGGIREDVGTKDLLNLVMGSCHAASQSGVDGLNLQQLIDIILAGIKNPN